MKQFYEWHHQTFEYRFAYIHTDYQSTIIKDYYEIYKRLLGHQGANDLLFMESFIDGIRLYWEPRLKTMIEFMKFLKNHPTREGLESPDRLLQLDNFVNNCARSIRSIRTSADDNTFDEHIRRFLSYLGSNVIISSTDCHCVIDSAFDEMENISFSSKEESIANILNTVKKFQMAIDEYFKVFDKKYPQHRLRFNWTMAFLEDEYIENEKSIHNVQKHITRLERFLRYNVYHMVPFEA